MHPTLLARLGVMVILLLGLTVPIVMIDSVVSERASRKNEVAQTIGREWGSTQTIGGPILMIPYRHSWRDGNGLVRERVERLFMLPDALEIEGVVDPGFRRRGIFEVVVYTARLKVRGRFPKPDFASIRPSPAIIDWNDATIEIGVADPRGISRRIEVNVSGRQVQARPGVTGNGLFSAGVRAAAEG